MSKQVTRLMADEAAKQLAEIAFGEKAKAAHIAECEFGDYIINKYIPGPVLAVGKEFDSYFLDKGKYVQCVSEYPNGVSVSLGSNIINPLPRKYLTINCEDFKQAKKLKSNYNNLVQDKSNYEGQVSDALVQLKTFKRIKEHFPEALPYLNFSDSTALVPQFEKLRALLNN